MIENKKILVMGGDLRQSHLAFLLSDKNEVIMYNGSLLQPFDYIILPMPVSVDGATIFAPLSDKPIFFDEVLAFADCGTVVLGGKFDSSLKSRLENKNVTCIDFLEREELAILNAIPTAEGALQIAIAEQPTTIHGSKCLIVGYGRIAKVLAPMLRSLGAIVTVSARKYSDIAWIKANNFKSIETSKIADIIADQEIIFNTVPAKVLCERVLTKVSSNSLVIDLASKPGGVDFSTAKLLGVRTVWALSLPGKIAPITAGEIIYTTINNIADERRYTI